MIEDMKLRGLTPCTRTTYLGAVKVLARYYNSRLDEITQEQVRDFLFYLHDSKGYTKSTYKVYLSDEKTSQINHQLSLIIYRLYPIDQSICPRAIYNHANLLAARRWGRMSPFIKIPNNVSAVQSDRAFVTAAHQKKLVIDLSKR